MTPKVWFVAYPYPPLNATGVQRILKYIRSLEAQGYEVYVLTVQVNDSASSIQDKDYAKEVSGGLRCTVIHTPTWYDGRKPSSLDQHVKRLLCSAAYRVFRDGSIVWLPYLRRRMARLLADHGKPDFVLSSGSPFLPFVEVARFCRRHSIPYVLDYRDTWSLGAHKIGGNVVNSWIPRLIEKKVNAGAAFLVTVSNAHRRYYSQDNANVVTLYNFPDRTYRRGVVATKPEFLGGEARNALRLVFAGTLAGQERSLRPIAKALSVLPVQLSAHITVEYLGSDRKQAIEDFSAMGMSSALTCRGAVSKTEAVNAIRRADVLLSLLHNTEWCENEAVRGIISTKIFDYLLTDKPIINIAPRDNELVAWLAAEEFAGIWSFTANETQAIAETLVRLLEQKCRTTYQRETARFDWNVEFHAFAHLLKTSISHESEFSREAV